MTLTGARAAREFDALIELRGRPKRCVSLPHLPPATMTSTCWPVTRQGTEYAMPSTFDRALVAHAPPEHSIAQKGADPRSAWALRKSMHQHLAVVAMRALAVSLAPGAPRRRGCRRQLPVHRGHGQACGAASEITAVLVVSRKHWRCECLSHAPQDLHCRALDAQRREAGPLSAKIGFVATPPSILVSHSAPRAV